MQKLTYIANIVVNTSSVRVAARVAALVHDADAVRGSCKVAGCIYLWSTIQQYEYWGSFYPDNYPF